MFAALATVVGFNGLWPSLMLSSKSIVEGRVIEELVLDE